MDGGRDDVTEICARRMGLTGKSSDEPPTVEKATVSTKGFMKLRKRIKFLSTVSGRMHFNRIEIHD